MKSMQLIKVGKPLQLCEVEIPSLDDDEILIKVLACGVCRTDLHFLQGDLKTAFYPITLGHQAVGVAIKAGKKAEEKVGQRFGAAWLAKSCQECFYCKKNEENLCENALFHGKDVHGGFAEYMKIKAEFAFPLSPDQEPEKQAPLLCSGMIGYRAYQKLGDAQTIGFYGFGSAAHLLLQLGVHQKRKILVFTKKNDVTAQNYAKELGAFFAGSSTENSPCLLDGAIIFATDGNLVPFALSQVRPGGKVVCAGIHMSDIPSFPYASLWHERKLESVANLTREDGYKLLQHAKYLDPRITTFPLEKANEALMQVGKIPGSIVIKMS